MTDHHHHDGPTVVETERDSSAGLIVGVLVALLIVFLIWLFMFGPMNIRGDDVDDNNGDVTNIREGDEGDTDTDVNIQEPADDTGGDTGNTGDTGGTSP